MLTQPSVNLTHIEKLVLRKKPKAVTVGGEHNYTFAINPTFPALNQEKVKTKKSWNVSSMEWYGGRINSGIDYCSTRRRML